MAVHVNASWLTRMPEGKPYQEVRTVDTERLSVAFLPGNGGDGWGHTITRADARLLARRINECLDATTSRGEYGRCHRGK